MRRNRVSPENLERLRAQVAEFRAMNKCPCGARGNWQGWYCPVCEDDQWLRDMEAKQDQREREQQEREDANREEQYLGGYMESGGISLYTWRRLKPGGDPRKEK